MSRRSVSKFSYAYLSNFHIYIHIMGTRLVFRLYSYMCFVIAPSGIEPHSIDIRQDYTL